MVFHEPHDTFLFRLEQFQQVLVITTSPGSIRTGLLASF